MNTIESVHSRHIRMDIYDKNKYNGILNSATITTDGRLHEVDEYLPAREILISTKFNALGHARNVC